MSSELDKLTYNSKNLKKNVFLNCPELLVLRDQYKYCLKTASPPPQTVINVRTRWVRVEDVIEWISGKNCQLLMKDVWSFLDGASSKEPACQCRSLKREEVWFLGLEDPLEEDMATHSSILAWRIPMDRGACWGIVHSIAKSLTWLKCLTTHTHMSNWEQLDFEWYFFQDK